MCGDNGDPPHATRAQTPDYCIQRLVCVENQRIAGHGLVGAPAGVLTASRLQNSPTFIATLSCCGEIWPHAIAAFNTYHG